MNVRAGQLQEEYVKKARATDRRMKVREGIVGPVETKLLSLGNVAGIVLGKGEDREV